MDEEDARYFGEAMTPPMSQQEVEIEGRCDLLDAYESLRTLIIDNLDEGAEGEYTLSMSVETTRRMWMRMDELRKAIANLTKPSRRSAGGGEG